VSGDRASRVAVGVEREGSRVTIALRSRDEHGVVACSPTLSLGVGAASALSALLASAVAAEADDFSADCELRATLTP